MLGTVFVSLTSYPSGLSLDPIMPGCSQYTDSLVMLSPFLGGAPVQTLSLAVPTAIGGQFFAQSIVLAPAVIGNPLGGATSNGLSFQIGSY